VIADSVFLYPSEHTNNTSFGGIFANAGLQYTIRVNKNDMLRLGAVGSLKRKFTANSEALVQTFQQNATTGQIDSIDVVSREKSSGKITYPGHYGVGMMFYKGDRWLIGADYNQTQWSDYTFFGSKDSVQDSWQLHVGGQILPNVTSTKSYWNRVTYRAGVTFGQDYVKVYNKLPTWGASIGFGLPMRPPSYTNQYSIINLAFEFGQRGNNVNIVRENYFKVGIGLTLSDIWFIKRKYD
jgi:hypothetical protein